MKEIANKPGYYVTVTGQVWSSHSNKWLRLNKTHKGYLKAQFKDHTGVFVHRLVAAAYLPNPHNLPQVNHINEDKTNNHLFNLEWCTNEYNELYSKAKWWTVITPEGDTVEVYNLKQFCIDNNINRGNLGARGKAQGYRLV